MIGPPATAGWGTATPAVAPPETSITPQEAIALAPHHPVGLAETPPWLFRRIASGLEVDGHNLDKLEALARENSVAAARLTAATLRVYEAEGADAARAKMVATLAMLLAMPRPDAAQWVPPGVDCGPPAGLSADDRFAWVVDTQTAAQGWWLSREADQAVETTITPSLQLHTEPQAATSPPTENVATPEVAEPHNRAMADATVDAHTHQMGGPEVLERVRDLPKEHRARLLAGQPLRPAQLHLVAATLGIGDLEGDAEARFLALPEDPARSLVADAAREFEARGIDGSMEVFRAGLCLPGNQETVRDDEEPPERCDDNGEAVTPSHPREAVDVGQMPGLRLNGGDVRVRVLPQLHHLIPPQSADERRGLEASLMATGGARDALVAARIDGQVVLLDGHNRLEICAAHNLPYDVIVLGHITTIQAAREWIIANQLGRRNLSREAIAYLRGVHYNSIKGARGGDRRANLHNAGLLLAAQYKVDEATIGRCATFALQLDDLARDHGPEVRSAVLARDARMGMVDVARLAKMDEPLRKQVLDKVIEEGLSVRRAAKAVGAPTAAATNGPPDTARFLERLAADIDGRRAGLEDHVAHCTELGHPRPPQLAAKDIIRQLNALHEALLNLAKKIQDTKAGKKCGATTARGTRKTRGASKRNPRRRIAAAVRVGRATPRAKAKSERRQR